HAPPPVAGGRRWGWCPPPRVATRAAAAALALWVVGTAEPFPLYWAAWLLTGGPAPTPRAFTHGCAPRVGGGGVGVGGSGDGRGAAAAPSARLAYVVPLIPRQVPRLVDSLAAWGDAAGRPCGPPAAPAEPPVDLVFLTDGPAWAPADRAAVAAALPPPARACFTRVRFLGAGLSGPASVNTHAVALASGTVSTGGSNAQFRAALAVDALAAAGREAVVAAGAAADAAAGGAAADAAAAGGGGRDAPGAAAAGALLAAAYDVAFYGEPDTWPLRARWLAALQAAADAAVATGAWVVGSPMRYAPKFNVAAEPARGAYARHINGNALYRLGDPCFAAYLTAVRGAYGDAAFDVAMNLYRSGLRRARVAQDTAWRFAYTDVVAHLSLTAFDVGRLREELPHTYLVHGKARMVRPGQWGFLKY
ncbi:hypothetical protein BU14_2916s0001, partial [Porphyra umbilicalis]